MQTYQRKSQTSKNFLLCYRFQDSSFSIWNNTKCFGLTILLSPTVGYLEVFLQLPVVILCLACECNTMVLYVAYIHELCMTLTFDLNIKIIFSP